MARIAQGNGVVSEKDRIEAALSAAGGNVTRAALLLKCSRRTLQKRMKKYGFPPGKPGSREHEVGVGVELPLPPKPEAA